MQGTKPFKSGVETRRRIRGHSQLKPATPAANLMPNVLLCIPVDHTREAERGVLMSGQPSSSIQLPRLAPWRGYSSAAASATDQHDRQQLRVTSPEHIGGASIQKSVGKYQAHDQHQDRSVIGLCSQYSHLRK